LRCNQKINPLETRGCEPWLYNIAIPMFLTLLCWLLIYTFKNLGFGFRVYLLIRQVFRCSWMAELVAMMINSVISNVHLLIYNWPKLFYNQFYSGQILPGAPSLALPLTGYLAESARLLPFSSTSSGRDGIVCLALPSTGRETMEWCSVYLVPHFKQNVHQVLLWTCPWQLSDFSKKIKNLWFLFLINL
jgi:hypothetical protein